MLKIDAYAGSVYVFLEIEFLDTYHEIASDTHVLDNVIQMLFGNLTSSLMTSA